MISGKIIDLTAEIYDRAPTMPMDPKCSVMDHSNLDTLGYNQKRVTFSTHQGTHIDVPYHFFYEGETLEKVDPSRFIVDAIKVDLTSKKSREAIVVGDLLKYEQFIDKGLSILIHTGWDKMISEKGYFSDFPYISIELSRWFSKKKIKIIGMDLPCPNVSDWATVHRDILGSSTLIVEGLVNMEKLEDKEFLFIALPLKIKGSDGSPVRAIAIID
ncbi:cyclase family protein [Actinomycetota bacterium]